VAGLSLRGYAAEVGEGWAMVRRSASVRLGMLVLGAVWLAGGFMHVAGNQHIQQHASIPGMERVGVLLTVLGLGAALGTWLVQRALRSWRPHVILGVGLVAAAAAVAGFAVSSRFAVYAATGFAIGVSIAPVFVLSETLLQRGTDLAQRGRVFSARDFMMRLAFMIAVATAGTIARASGTPAALLVGAGLLLVAGALTLGLTGLRAPDAPAAGDDVVSRPR